MTRHPLTEPTPTGSNQNMTIKSTAITTGMAALALTAMGLVAAAPASAHTNNMYTYVIYDDMSEQAGFATYGKTDGVTTPLPTTFVPEMIYLAGIEVANEKGTAVGYREDAFVRTWNHITGERGVEVAVYLNAGVPAELSDIVGLDTLNDGRTITLVYFYTEGEPPVAHWSIAEVNAGTGELTTLFSLDDAVFFEEGEGLLPTSIATDPATGITYVFLQAPDGTVGFLSVNVAASAFVDEPTQLAGEYFVEGEVLGVDFDQATGELFFTYDNYGNQQLELLKFTTAPSTWPTAAPVFISTAPAEYEDVSLAPLALTIEHTTLAATGSELPVLAIVLAGTVAVVAGGVTVAVARRRSEAGTV